MRTRMSKSKVSDLLTLSENFEIYACENFLLEGAVTPSTAYWGAHTLHFYMQVSGRLAEAYQAQDAFLKVRELVATGLTESGFPIESRQIATCNTEGDLNRQVVRQYTSDSGLYERVNGLLRQGHSDVSISHDPLVPWICHLNASIRLEEEYPSTSYRGTELSESDIAKYQPGVMFVWASFTSVSTKIDACLDGNTLFTIRPVSALSEYGKRAPRLIDHLSDFPEENEALLPLGCAFRVVSNQKEGFHTRIDLELLDHY